MSTINKQLLRLALAIHGQLREPHLNESVIELPTSSWDRCAEIARQIRRARLRGWHLAANELFQDLSFNVISLEDELAKIRARMPRATEPHRVSTVSDIYHDLLALSQEFDGLEYDVRDGRVSVTTEPIVLQGVYLGPFEIKLEWDRQSRRDSPGYSVIAKDPHPAESRDNVTHPHVSDDFLCEGDGRHAIRQALTQGRLLDFFTLIAGVLRTYNSESPYVELSLWSGSACSDCGSLVDDECSYSCNKCGYNICGECESACCGCDDSCCSGCISPCMACEDNYCRQCLKPCDGCQKFVCSGCFDEHERCPNCHEEESENDPGNDDTIAASVGVAIQPHGVGQAAVPA